MKIAVIGTGVIGRLRAQTVLDNPATELVGVADVNRASAAATAESLKTRAYVDYRSMIDETRPDAVVVASPVTLHEEMCTAAFERGCHVLVEKPMANSLAACQAIIDAGRRAQRVLSVGFNHRFYPAIQYLKQVLAENRIGSIDHARIFGGHDGLHNFRADWMYKGELSGGGCMMDVGIHMTDLARHVVGEIVEVYGVASGRVWQVPGSEDNAMAVMKTAAGIPVIYQSTWTEWRGFGWHVDIYGTGGMVRASYAPMFNLLVTQERPGAKRSKSYKLYPEVILREKVKGWETTTKLTFDGELADFVRRVGGDVHAGSLADGWSGFRANEIAQALYQSTAEGSAVKLSPVAEIA